MPPVSTSPAGSDAGAGATTAASVIYENRCCGCPSVGAHPHALVALERLALGLERRRDHDLGAVELREVLVTAGRHRRPQATEQVERAVVLARRADEDLLERPVLRGRDPRAAWEAWMERRHAPVKTPARGLVGARERGADHHRVGAER